jgi:hypothetical protein
MAVEFPQKPTTTVEALWLACQRAFWELRGGAKAYPIKDVAVGTTQIAQAHGAKAIPQTCLIVSKTAGVTAALTSPFIDERFIYVTASGAGTVDLVVIP